MLRTSIPIPVPVDAYRGAAVPEATYLMNAPWKRAARDLESS